MDQGASGPGLIGVIITNVARKVIPIAAIICSADLLLLLLLLVFSQCCTWPLVSFYLRRFISSCLVLIPRSFFPSSQGSLEIVIGAKPKVDIRSAGILQVYQHAYACTFALPDNICEPNMCTLSRLDTMYTQWRCNRDIPTFRIYFRSHSL